MSFRIGTLLITRVLGNNLKIIDKKAFGRRSKNTDKKENKKNDKEWPHVPQIAINRTLVLKIFSAVSKDTDHTRLKQQSIKYRKKTLVGPSKNTYQEAKEKKGGPLQMLYTKTQEKTTIQVIARVFTLHANAKRTEH